MDVCVIIPIYKDSFSENELISYNRTIEIFSERMIILVCPYKIEMFAESLCRKKINIKTEYFENKYFKGIIGYNRLLMSLNFYDRFTEYENILICQLDVFVIKDELDFWIQQKFDNIGAPIFEGYSKDKNKKIKKNGSNGGFCLRNTKSCMKTLSLIGNSYSKLSTLWGMESIWYWKLFRIIRDGVIFNSKFLKPRLNEDMFWSIIVPDKFPWFYVCEPSKAKYFAFDANPSLLFQLCNFTYPMAIHAWWRYDKPFVMQIIKDIENI